MFEAKGGYGLEGLWGSKCWPIIYERRVWFILCGSPEAAARRQTLNKYEDILRTEPNLNWIGSRIPDSWTVSVETRWQDTHTDLCAS